MYTIKQVFIDSSVFIEGSKKNNAEFYDAILSSKVFKGYINDIVCSETWYLFLGLLGGSSPLAVKQKAGIKQTVTDNEHLFSFYNDYLILPLSLEVVGRALGLMKTYNLLPNDALILATCIHNQIPFLASHDSDFERACAAEGITLITPANFTKHIAL